MEVGITLFTHTTTTTISTSADPAFTSATEEGTEEDIITTVGMRTDVQPGMADIEAMTATTLGEFKIHTVPERLTMAEAEWNATTDSEETEAPSHAKLPMAVSAGAADQPTEIASTGIVDPEVLAEARLVKHKTGVQ